MTTTTPIPNLLSLEEISSLFLSLSPSQPRDIRTQGTITLATYVTQVRGSKGVEGGTAEITHIFARPLEERLGSTSPHHALQALYFLNALFTVDPLGGEALLKKEETRSHLHDVVDIFAGDCEVETALAALLSQAAGVKACRSVVNDEWSEWIKRTAQSGGKEGKTKALLALLKLSRGFEESQSPDLCLEKEGPKVALAEQLAREIGSTIDNDTEPLDTVEALAHLSLSPAVREALSTNTECIRAVLSLPHDRGQYRSTLPLLYGVATIISNIVAYRPKLAGEEAQLERLRRMAKGGVTSAQKLRDEPVPLLERDEAVHERCRRLLRAGVAPVLVSLARAGAESAAVREAVGRAYLSLVEDKDTRGAIIQAGGAKALQAIISGGLATKSSAPSTASYATASASPFSTEDGNILLPIQALAKLAITSSPLLLFGPTASASVDAIRPFYTLLSHPQATLLQQFEALMALTNLASLGTELSTRISQQPGLLNSLDQLMLDDNMLVRRAATELLCNLVSCETVFTRYTGEAGAQGRLHVLFALSDVDDKPTRLAASGALAMLSDSPLACGSLLTLPKGAENTFSIIVQLLDPSLVPKIVEIDTSVPLSESKMSEEREREQPDLGLQHRGTLILRNLLLHSQPPPDVRLAEQAGAVQALVAVLKARGSEEGSEGMIMAAVEALKWFVQKGVRVEG